MRVSGFIGSFVLCLLAGVACGQGVGSLPKLYPSNLTAYDLENGMPITCISGGLMDRQGRFWFNACYEQAEHQTINFFQYDGRRSELIYLDSLPPGTEQSQAALAGMTETGEFYGFFRFVSPYFFLFDPETRQTRFYQLASADIRIIWMTSSAEHGLLLGAETPGSMQVHCFKNGKTELLLDYPNIDIPRIEYTNQPYFPLYQVLAGDELWCYAKPSVYYVQEEVREQFKLLCFNLRNNNLRVFSYDDLFSETSFPKDASIRQFILCADAHDRVLMLDSKRLYEIDGKTGKAVLRAVFDHQARTEQGTYNYYWYRAQKDAAGNLLFVLPDERDYFRGILLDTAGQYFDYSAVLQQTSGMTRFGQIHFTNVWSHDFRRSMLAFSAGGLVAADIQFYGSISYSIKDAPTRAINEWRPDQYLVRTENWGNSLVLARLREDPAEQSPPPTVWADDEFNFGTLSNLVKSSDGFWWYGAPNVKGLIRIDSNKVRTNFPIGVPFEKFTFLDTKNVALVSGSQVFFYNVATGKRRLWQENGKPLTIPGVTNQLFLSKDSTLWIASLQGLWQLSLRSGKSRKVGSREGFRDERIMCISEDKDGRLWLGTYGSGLHIFDPRSGTILITDKEKGLSNNTVIGILEDADGDWWLSTYRGLNLLSPTGKVKAQFFEQDGLSTNEFNRYSCFKDSKGRLIFGSIHGINIIEPEALKAQLPQAGDLHLYLASVSYYDARQGANQTRLHNFDQMGVIALPATHRYLNLNFALSSLIRPEDQTFFYKIERPDQKQASEWIYLGNKPQLSLPDLPPGKHHILIRGADYRGNQAEVPIMLTVHVGRFFYQETWFYLLCFLLVSTAAGYWIYRQRILRKNLEKELAARTEEIMDTRDQLIAQEKLASLGQMVAGIAHEIKNPLNFVNNFSEGSEELLAELGEELEQYRERPDDATFDNIKAILEDLRLNAIDIVNYGTQADRIVKSMMDHARGTSGQRLSVDLNKLVEDNLSLAYHGFRAVHPTFQVHLEKELAPDLEPLEVFPQDLGRVLLNILNNACFAANEKQKSAGGAYHPAIRVSTTAEGGDVVIRIRDNGPGIPAEVRDKIFQPFFTTKPTGEGNTGLGLSISYDIITLQHKGKISVDSQPGEFTEFVIRLPRL
ncbi:MAG: hypothetical protein EP344_17460 [Bacteroidetes bacterium]|nr:MAG: hypothetical protein EP344_17460 [Bacteroidota bacterium]